jgi:lipid-A-disaccharide synthase
MNFFLIAGEPSGDKLGAALMAGLRLLQPGAQFHGVGGPLMAQEGLQSLFPMHELSVMGIAEVLPKYRALMRRIEQTAKDVVASAPDALITIDSPDFCLRVARRVKQACPEIPTIHYVAPTVWAWRPKRALKMAQVIDHVLALFPFEPPFMTEAGMTCDFVGHPVVAEPLATASEAAAFRDKAGIAPDAPLLLALPGSRKGEVARLGPRFGASLVTLAKGHPNLRVVVPTVAPVVDILRPMLAEWPGAPVLLDPEDIAGKRAAFAAADVALAASGTVSIELAASMIPMVIAYDMNWLSRIIISAMLRIDTVTLVNLVSETRVVPEFVGPKCRPDLIAQGLAKVMADPDAQNMAMDLTLQRLGRGTEAPGVRAARSVLAHLEQPTPV